MKTIATYFKRLSVIVITTTLVQANAAIGFAQIDNQTSSIDEVSEPMVSTPISENGEDAFLNVDPIKISGSKVSIVTTNELSLNSAYTGKNELTEENQKGASLSDCLSKNTPKAPKKVNKKVAKREAVETTTE